MYRLKLGDISREMSSWRHGSGNRDHCVDVWVDGWRDEVEGRGWKMSSCFHPGEANPSHHQIKWPGCGSVFSSSIRHVMGLSLA